MLLNYATNEERHFIPPNKIPVTFHFTLLLMSVIVLLRINFNPDMDK